MEIELVRFATLADKTLGRIRYNGRELYTIEREWLGNEVNVSCIPEGPYKLKRVNSPRFGSNMWEVAEVPDRTHILIHVANYAHDVIGCIGLGLTVFGNLGGVGSSRKAIKRFYDDTQAYDTMNLTIRTGAIGK